MTYDFKPAKAGGQAPRLSKEEYAQKKRAEKDAVYQMADESAREIVSDPEKFKSFLDTQSRIDRYSAVNALLIYKQYPQAVQLKDFDDWSKDNVKILKGTKSISILEPVEYVKRDGTTGISYNVKKVFDISQTNGKRPPAPTVDRDPKQLITTLLDSSPVNVEATNELPYPNMAAFYNNEEQTLYVNGNSFILGVSGGGKSFAAKGEIENIILSSDADVIIIDPEREYSHLVNALGGEIINISATSPNHINAMDMNKDYGDGANPVILKSEFIMSLCEQLIGGTNLGAKQKSIIDRCTASVYRMYQQNDYTGSIPTLQDFRDELLKQDEPEAKEIALAIELFTHGSLNTFAKQTNVDTHNRLICYDILDLGKQLMPIGMLVVLDSILNRITQNRAKGKNTFIFIDEIYLLFQHEYSANFLFTLWKRVRKYCAYASGITQNVDDLLQSHTARTMLANSEFIIMLNQASTDRLELAKLLNISDLQLSYITNVDAGHGLIKVGSSLVPFANKFPKNTKLYKLMTTKPGEV